MFAICELSTAQAWSRHVGSPPVWRTIGNYRCEERRAWRRRGRQLKRPDLGPIIGGWITDTLNWHWLFYVNLAPGIAVTLLVPFLVDIDKPDLRLLKDADYPGIILMAISLGTLEYVLEEGTRWNWFDDTHGRY